VKAKIENQLSNLKESVMSKINGENNDDGTAANGAVPTVTQKSAGMSRRLAITAGIFGASAAAISTPLAAKPAEAGDRAARGELSGKTAFITGGARGIGLAIGEELAKVGANIVIYDIASGTLPNVQYAISTDADLQRAKAKIEALGVRCLAVQGDVRNLASLSRAMQRTVTEFGSLDIVVANAGISQAGGIEEFSDEQIAAVLDINVAGVIKTTQAAGPIMKRQNSGRIIYISSALGRMGNELFPVYTASKWAVIGFAKSAALTYGRNNILCNVVAPGLVRTPLADNAYIMGRMMPDDSNRSFDRFSEMNRGNSPINIGHLEPIDVARAVRFFAGEATAKVTGEVFDVSYGSLARSIA
jgi:NAD(P)-dependent dehydrogenase (short-subunit alcohol dehydrogenase family)